ncbi:MAG TPA: aminotransferase class I/II-fold pyridoxal phosphate-dependent enzyme, partial [Thermoanaerobaculia bacterium]|nr:aminotransferase class I/II-fold pyridoxal phosphate-dependent enzyme [Thermoanaerobaculia bacterium]
YFSCVPAYNQWGAKVAIESPESLVSIAKMVAAFQQRRDIVVAALNAIDGVTCQTPRGAFYVFPNIAGLCARLGVIDAYNTLPEAIRERTSPSTLFQMFLLYEHKVATLDRKSFGRFGSAGKHFFRISIASSLDDLETAVQRLAAAASDRAGFRKFMAAGRHLA